MMFAKLSTQHKTLLLAVVSPSTTYAPGTGASRCKMKCTIKIYNPTSGTFPLALIGMAKQRRPSLSTLDIELDGYSL